MDMHASFHSFLQCKQGMKEEQMLSSSSLGKIYRNAFLQVNRCLSSSSMILASPFRYASSLLGIHVGNTAGSGRYGCFCVSRLLLQLYFGFLSCAAANVQTGKTIGCRLPARPKSPCGPTQIKTTLVRPSTPPENGCLPCARNFAVCISSGARQKEALCREAFPTAHRKIL
jgi:hypothetical protein